MGVDFYILQSYEFCNRYLVSNALLAFWLIWPIGHLGLCNHELASSAPLLTSASALSYVYGASGHIVDGSDLHIWANHCCIMFFCRLTAISVRALLNATAEAVSDNRELTRVFHQTVCP